MQPIKIAILAMGGEGGGVLADWIVDLGEANGHIAQTTSVPGVAQRTGATIYYVELYPKAQAQADRGEPVLALMPLQGDVDIVLASELMEAGRAVQRGFVTSDRTTLIASTHRVYSIAEKSALGDGRVDSAQLLEHARNAAKRFIRFDMAQLAQQSGSVISSVLFGALAGSGELPFSRAAFEATIERSDMGVGPSLKAFAAAFDRAQSAREDGVGVGVQTPGTGASATAPLGVAPSKPRHPRVRALVERVQQQFPLASQDVLLEGVRRLIDYQDLDYATLYLDRMRDVSAVASDDAGAVARTTARHLALWMSYEDTARVADLKTRDSRFERVRTESGALSEHVLAINEYMHPRMQEICETLPAGFGRWLMKPGAARSLVERLTQRGRVIRTSSLRGYLMLRAVAGMKRWRRSTLRYAEENTRIQAWLECIIATAKKDPALAIEVAECQRLVKGYSDTHERGVRNYDLLMDALQRAGEAIAPATLHELREAALADEHGNALRAALVRQSLA
jgi:indolepyruvate ferredoxin oxidoreductase beta subunit